MPPYRFLQHALRRYVLNSGQKVARHNARKILKLCRPPFGMKGSSVPLCFKLVSVDLTDHGQVQIIVHCLVLGKEPDFNGHDPQSQFEARSTT